MRTCCVCHRAPAVLFPGKPRFCVACWNANTLGFLLDAEWRDRTPPSARFSQLFKDRPPGPNTITPV